MRLLGVGVDNLTRAEAVREIELLLARDPGVASVSTTDSNSDTQLVAFVNAHCLNQAWEDPVYRETINRAALVLPDGIGVKLAARMRAREIRDNCVGTDFFPLLCQTLQGGRRRLYLLGSRPGVARAVAERLSVDYPQLPVVGVQHGFFGNDEVSVVEKIRASGAEVLLVAMGVPTQELFIDRHRGQLGVRVALGVGALFDIYSGRFPRCPPWLRRLHLEWLWRMGLEPARLWRRYLVGNPLFLYRAWRTRQAEATWNRISQALRRRKGML